MIALFFFSFCEYISKEKTSKKNIKALGWPSWGRWILSTDNEKEEGRSVNGNTTIKRSSYRPFCHCKDTKVYMSVDLYDFLTRRG
jgi:hypothetical protein